METKYTEIFRLRDMLDSAGIEYLYTDESFCLVNTPYEHYHIEVFNPNNHKRIISVIEGNGSYGREQNLLEIMGCLTPEEAENGSVAGWLTAEDVFERIKNALSGLKEADNERYV